MSERPTHRRPATFKLDDPGVVVMDPDDAGRPSRGTVHITPEADPALLPVADRGADRAGAARFPLGRAVLDRGRRAGAARRSGLASTHLIEDLFARSEGLGFLGLALPSPPRWRWSSSIAREAFGLARLATIEKLHLRAAAVLAERRPRREPGHRAGPAQDRASESATGARPRHAARAMPTTSSTAPT